MSESQTLPHYFTIHRSCLHVCGQSYYHGHSPDTRRGKGLGRRSKRETHSFFLQRTVRNSTQDSHSHSILSNMTTLMTIPAKGCWEMETIFWAACGCCQLMMDTTLHTLKSRQCISTPDTPRKRMETAPEGNGWFSSTWLGKVFRHCC